MPEPSTTRFAYDDTGLDAARGRHQFVVNRLGLMIAAGELAEDSQILPDEVCERFGVSRPVVREALRVLEAKGMVSPKPKTGTRVLPIHQWNLLDQDVISWRIMGPHRARQLSELTDLRVAVEIYAARKCAIDATAEQLAEMHKWCDAMAAAAHAGNLEEFTEADIAFHTALLDASGNSVFQQFATPFAVFLHAKNELHTLPERVDDEVLDNHRGVVEAIAAHDADLAESLCRKMIEASRAELLRNLPQD